MGITYNPGSGLKTVSEIKINPSGTLRNVIEVWENVGGVLKQVWPDTAYDGSHFAGELRGGVITDVYSNPRSGSGESHGYAYMNNINCNDNWHDPTAITSGGLYRNINNPRGTQAPYNTVGNPYGFISAAAIDFTKYSKIRVTGKIKYTFTAWITVKLYFGSHLTIEPVYRYSATEQPYRYVRRNANSLTSDLFARWWDVKVYADATATSGDLPFDITFDISSWTTKTDQIAFYFDCDPATSAAYSDFQHEWLDMSVTGIEFIK